MSAVLRALQGGLESMYRVSTSLDVGDFLVDERERQGYGAARAPEEQLFVQQRGDEMSIGLYVNHRALEHLSRSDPRHRLDDENLDDFLLALEGVSHFVYLAQRAQASRPVSAVELELQAEVDKWLVVLLVSWDQTGTPPVDLRRRLFGDVRLLEDLSSEERDRYALANAAANDYALALERRFVQRGAVDELLAELRRFYQLDLGGKLDRISRAG
jgi:hypothetical protein